jgi:hypothetical protein
MGVASCMSHASHEADEIFKNSEEDKKKLHTIHMFSKLYKSYLIQSTVSIQLCKLSTWLYPVISLPRVCNITLYTHRACGQLVAAWIRVRKIHTDLSYIFFRTNDLFRFIAQPNNNIICIYILFIEKFECHQNWKTFYKDNRIIITYILYTAHLYFGSLCAVRRWLQP